MAVTMTGWDLLKTAETDSARKMALVLIHEELDTHKSIKAVRKYIDSYAPNKDAKLHLWTEWVKDEGRLECVSLRQLASALRDALPEVQVLVVIAWCNVVDLNQYGRDDGKYPRQALCQEAFAILSDRQNEYKLAWAIKQAVDGQVILCESEHVVALGERIRALMCPDKAITFEVGRVKLLRTLAGK